MGRTSKGDNTPWLRMLAASSLQRSFVEVRRGLVGDSIEPIERQVAVLGWFEL